MGKMLAPATWWRLPQIGGSTLLLVAHWCLRRGRGCSGTTGAAAGGGVVNGRGGEMAPPWFELERGRNERREEPGKLI